jgi:hypothetical protein
MPEHVSESAEIWIRDPIGLPRFSPQSGTPYIIFEMRDLKVITHEMFGDELGRIPPSAMWFVELLIGYPIQRILIPIGFKPDVGGSNRAFPRE